MQITTIFINGKKYKVKNGFVIYKKKIQCKKPYKPMVKK